VEIVENTELRRASRAAYGELPEESVLLDIEGEKAVRLNETGAWLWKRLETPATVAELAAALAAEFGIDESRALADVSAFAADLAGRELLETD